MDISLADLRYFKAAAASGNLSKAAEVLGIRQSSLSAAIKRLEEALETPLFYRGKKGVTLTRAGEYFLSNSKEVIEKWEGLRNRTHDISGDIQGTYSIGCHPTPSNFFFPRILPPLLERHPLLDLSIVHDNSPALLDRVLAHKLDLAIVTDPQAHPDLVIKPLRKDTVGFFSIEAKLNPKESILICDPQLKHTQILLGKLTRRRINFRKTITSSSLDVIARLVASGVGTGILPANAIDSLATRNVRLVEDLPKSHGEICLVFRHELMRLKAFQEMVRLILSLDLTGG